MRRQGQEIVAVGAGKAGVEIRPEHVLVGQLEDADMIQTSSALTGGKFSKYRQA